MPNWYDIPTYIFNTHETMCVLPCHSMDGSRGRAGWVAFSTVVKQEWRAQKENVPNEEGSSFEASFFEPSTPARLQGGKLPVLPSPSPAKPPHEITLNLWNYHANARCLPQCLLRFDPMLLTREAGWCWTNCFDLLRSKLVRENNFGNH